MKWRSISLPADSEHFSRTWGPRSWRNAKQALLRVLELMLEAHLAAAPADALARKQLRRVQAARRAEEPDNGSDQKHLVNVRL